MSDKIENSDIFEVGFQDDVDSFPIRESNRNIKNKHNNLVDTVASASIGTTNAETTAARTYHTSLNNRLDSVNDGRGNVIKTGGAPSERGTPDLNMQISALQASIAGIDVNKGFGSWTRSSTTISMTEQSHGRANGNIIYVEVSSDTGPLALVEHTIANVTTNTFEITGVDTGDTSGTAEFATLVGPIVAPVTNSRFDVVVFESDNSITIVSGAESADPVLPAVSSTQKAIAILSTVAATTSLNDGVEIIEARDQGCVYLRKGQWVDKWKVQDAIDDLDSVVGGIIHVGPGSYYEEIDFTGQSNVRVIFNPNSILFRVSDTANVLKSVNTVSNEETGIHIEGGDLRGNGKAGTKRLINFAFTDEFSIINTIGDGNASCTSDAKDLVIANCDQFLILSPKMNSYSITSVSESHVRIAGIERTIQSWAEVATSFSI